MNSRPDDLNINEIELTSMRPIKELLEALLSDDLDTIEEARQYVQTHHEYYLNECIKQGFKKTSNHQDNRDAQFLHALTISNPNQLDPESLADLLPRSRDKKYDPILAIKLILEASPTDDGRSKINLPNRNDLRIPFVEINECEIGGNSAHTPLIINRINLKYAKYTNGCLKNAEAEGSNLSCINASNSKWHDLKLANSNLRNLDASYSEWSHMDIAGCDITGINLKDITLEEINFFSAEELSDETKFTAALDRWYAMLTHKHSGEDHWYHFFAPKEHPQLKEIRKAMAANLADKLSCIPLSEKLYKIAYNHPMLSQHRNCTHISSAINSIFSTEQKSALETRAQETLRTEIVSKL